MNIHWIDTFAMYREVIAAKNQDERTALFQSSFVTPWQQMMAMVAGHLGGSGEEDPLAGARAWGWLLPEQLAVEPENMARLAEVQAWQRGQVAMATAVASFAPFAKRIPLDTIEGWLVLGDPAKADPLVRGYTGGIDFRQPRFVVQYFEANDYNLPRLEGCIVHEMHHLIRSQVVPWNMMTATVADYIVHEGLAESYAAALYGPQVVGYYVTEFDESQLEQARTLIAGNLETTGFDNLRGFIFGDTWAEKLGFTAVGMPDYGGYAIGYRVVQAYLERQGLSIEEATFVPAAEIVVGSGYFA